MYIKRQIIVIRQAYEYSNKTNSALNSWLSPNPKWLQNRKCRFVSCKQEEKRNEIDGARDANFRSSRLGTPGPVSDRFIQQLYSLFGSYSKYW